MSQDEDTIGYQIRDTPMGRITIYLKDEPGPRGHKAGTTKMEYHDPPPRPMRLKNRL